MANPHDELARLLEHAREDAPSNQLLSGVRERVLSATAAPATPIESMSVPRAAAPITTGAASWLIKLGLGAVVLGLVAAGYLATRSAAPQEKRAPAPQIVAPAPAAPLPSPVELAPVPAPPIESPATEPPVVEPKLKPRRVLRPPQAEPAPVAPPAPAPLPAPTSSFAEEVALLKLALDAQRAGRVDEARAKLAEHARRFPQGQLVSERKRIEARLPP